MMLCFQHFRMLLLSALVLLLPTVAHAASGLQGSGIPRHVDVKPRLGETIPLDLTFRVEDGHKVPLRRFFGQRPVLLNLVYFRCPMLCRMTSDGLVRALKSLEFNAGQEFTVLTISFNPREGPDLARSAKETALAQYHRPNASEGWRFLTGDKDQIEALTKAVGFQYSYDPETGQYAHAAGLFILTPQGEVSRFLTGVEFPPQDLRLAIVEASQNQVGSISDQVLLLCYQYDPAAGKYGLFILGVIRVAGIATVLLMGVGFMFLRRRGTPTREPAPQNDLEPTSIAD